MKSTSLIPETNEDLAAIRRYSPELTSALSALSQQLRAAGEVKTVIASQGVQAAVPFLRPIRDQVLQIFARLNATNPTSFMILPHNLALYAIQLQAEAIALVQRGAQEDNESLIDTGIAVQRHATRLIDEVAQLVEDLVRAYPSRLRA